MKAYITTEKKRYVFTSDNEWVSLIDFEPKEGVTAYYTTAPTYSDSSSYIEVESGSTIPSDITNMYFKPKTTENPDLKISGYGLKYVRKLFRPYETHNNITIKYYFGNIDLTDVDWSSVEDMDYFFESLTTDNFKSITGLENLDTSNVTTMRYALLIDSGSTTNDSFNNLDLSKWNTSKVTNMLSLFRNKLLSGFINLTGWDVSKVTYMGNMFNQATNLSEIKGLEGWNVSNVTNMGGMFNSCLTLTTLNVSGWDTSKVTSMYTMFYNCSKLTTLNLSGWNTSNVTYMSYMFENCSALTTLDLSGWDVSKVTEKSGMFSGCSKLKTFILKNMPNDSMFYLLANQISFIKYSTLHVDEASNALMDSSTRNKFTSNGITIVVE